MLPIKRVTHWSNEMRIAHFTDPEGHLLEVIEHDG